jgi:hypothetical protein
MSLPSDPPFRVTLSKKSLAAQRDSKDSAAVEAEVRSSFGPSIVTIVLSFAYFTAGGKFNTRLR